MTAERGCLSLSRTMLNAGMTVEDFLLLLFRRNRGLYLAGPKQGRRGFFCECKRQICNGPKCASLSRLFDPQNWNSANSPNPTPPQQPSSANSQSTGSQSTDLHLSRLINFLYLKFKKINQTTLRREKSLKRLRKMCATVLKLN